MAFAAHSTEIDVRAIPPRERHARIIALFDALDVGGELTLVSDHEPRPLRAQFEKARAEEFVWLQRMIAAEQWRVTLRRIARAAEREDLAGFLRRCALLADVRESTRSRLVAAASQHDLPRGHALVEQDARWDGFGILRDGAMSAIITSPYGREHALYDVLPAEPFGEVSLLDGGVTLARYEVTSERAHAITFPKPVVVEAMDDDASFVRALASANAQRTRILVDRFAVQTSLPTTARVAAVLLPHAGPEPGLQPALETLRGVTQAQIATAAGTVKEVVSRAFMELEQGGAIERRGGRIAKVDRERLHAFSIGL